MSRKKSPCIEKSPCATIPAPKNQNHFAVRVSYARWRHHRQKGIHQSTSTCGWLGACRRRRGASEAIMPPRAAPVIVPPNARMSIYTIHPVNTVEITSTTCTLINDSPLTKVTGNARSASPIMCSEYASVSRCGANIGALKSGRLSWRRASVSQSMTHALKNISDTSAFSGRGPCAEWGVDCQWKMSATIRNTAPASKNSFFGLILFIRLPVRHARSHARPRL